MCHFERTLNIHPSFVVSITVLIINIHDSRAVPLYLIKHRILIRGGFIDIKSLHVMYYRKFDWSFGLWIINKFLNKLYCLCIYNEILIKAFGLLIFFSVVFAILIQLHYCSINTNPYILIPININILDVIFTGIIPL